MRFQQKVVVVTGGASGIGLETAIQFASEGAIVALNDIDPTATETAASEIRSRGGQVLALPADVASAFAVEEAVDAVIRQFGQIDVLVNNAGIMLPGAADAITLDNQWRRCMTINVDGCFNWARAVATKSMIERRTGAIVNVASGAGMFGIPDNVGYVVSKHAVVGLTRSLAIDWARHNIRTNCVCPGLTETEMVRRSWSDNPAGLESRRRRTPMGRSASPQEQAAAILFLASEEASYVTGLIMNVDGGTHAMLSGATPRFDV